MKYIGQNLSNQFLIDGAASDILDSLTGRLSERLLEDIREYLPGFHPDLQVELADDIADFTSGDSVRYTGHKYIDRMLKAFYLLISEELGRDLGELIRVHKDGGHYRPTITINQTKTISFQ